MAWAVSHSGVHTPSSRTSTITWPRGLAVIGFLLIVASAWAGIVPFIGPTFGYGADGTSAWDWNLAHALLHAIPGAVGVLCGLAVMGHAGGGRWAARLSLSFWGLVTLATGAWLVVGPSAWPVFEHGVVFRTTGTAMDQFIRLVGYNLGIGGVILVLSGMILKAMTGEREIVLGAKDADVVAVAPVATAGPVPAEPTVAQPTVAQPGVMQPPAAADPVVGDQQTRTVPARTTESSRTTEPSTTLPTAPPLPEETA
jgi:hypothetical protein